MMEKTGSQCLGTGMTPSWMEPASATWMTPHHVIPVRDTGIQEPVLPFCHSSA
ncbi:hypothetical protein [Wolbachia endosymbiont of Dactylopius coccus]